LRLTSSSSIVATAIMTDMTTWLEISTRTVHHQIYQDYNMPKKITIELSEETAYRLQRLEESFKKHSGFTKKQTRNFLIDG